MEKFIRNDGAVLQHCPEIKSEILGWSSANPKSHWKDGDYAQGAQVKLSRWRERLFELDAAGISLERKRVLEVACGNAIDVMLLAMEPVEQVVGLDLRLALHLANKKGARHRRLASEVLATVGKNPDVWNALCDLPVSLVQADVTNMMFENNSFDLILSRSFLEHMIPIRSALKEMERVLAPGGVMYHVIDPFYWLRGCHAPALVDIPWAHARLQPEDYRCFVNETEGKDVAEQRCQWLASLNHFTPQTYRAEFDDRSLEIISWTETQSKYAEEKLARHPDVLDTLIDGVSHQDLVCDAIKVVARKPINV